MIKKMSCTILGVLIALSSFSQMKTTARLNHIALYVKNLESATAFYKDIMGLDTITNPFNDGRHTWFSIGEKSHLHIISGDEERLVPKKHTHVCFSVASVDEFIKKLMANKIPYEDWQGKANSVTLRTDGVKQIWFQDPDGYWIEINDAKE